MVYWIPCYRVHRSGVALQYGDWLFVLYVPYVNFIVCKNWANKTNGIIEGIKGGGERYYLRYR